MCCGSQSRAPFYLPRLACRAEASAQAGLQIFFQPGEGGFKGVVVLPVGEIGEVIFADWFRQIFAGGGSQTFPRAQGFHGHQPEGKRP